MQYERKQYYYLGISADIVQGTLHVSCWTPCPEFSIYLVWITFPIAVIFLISVTCNDAVSPANIIFFFSLCKCQICFRQEPLLDCFIIRPVCEVIPQFPKLQYWYTEKYKTLWFKKKWIPHRVEFPCAQKNKPYFKMICRICSGFQLAIISAGLPGHLNPPPPSLWFSALSKFSFYFQ